MYAHLMKYQFVKPRLPGWIGTIINMMEILNSISQVRWNDVENDPSKETAIKNKAIEVYTDDGNKNGEIYYTIVYSRFPRISMLKNRESILNFLIEEARKDNDESSKEM